MKVHHLPADACAPRRALANSVSWMVGPSANRGHELDRQLDLPQEEDRDAEFPSISEFSRADRAASDQNRSPQCVRCMHEPIITSVTGGAVLTAASIATYWGALSLIQLAIRDAHAHIE